MTTPQKVGAGETATLLKNRLVGLREELARMDAMQQQAMAAGLAERLRTDIRKTEAALDRVAAGSYGECCRYAAEIPAARLAADPAAPFCADCVKG